MKLTEKGPVQANAQAQDAKQASGPSAAETISEEKIWDVRDYNKGKGRLSGRRIKYFSLSNRDFCWKGASRMWSPCVTFCTAVTSPFMTLFCSRIWVKAVARIEEALAKQGNDYRLRRLRCGRY